jgi:hypothetical protein
MKVFAARLAYVSRQFIGTCTCTVLPYTEDLGTGLL